MSEKEKDTLQQENANTENVNEQDTPQENLANNADTPSAAHAEEAALEHKAEIEEDTPVTEIESDEHEEHDEYAEEAKELPDYGQMSKTQLLEEAEALIAKNNVIAIKEEMEALHKAAMTLFSEERAEKLEAFIENGGAEIDFKFEQPIKYKIQDCYKTYKSQRQAYYKQLEKELAANLDVKTNIIEAIKELPNQPGSVPEKYNLFKEYQERWKATGPVPRANSNELWQNYHHHLDNFYDFLRISNDLRNLDFKKNLAAKTQLCEEAEALAEKDSNANTFKALQELHAKWKQVGLVDKEHREPLWERFSAATKKIHDKRHAYYDDLREKRSELIERKKEILEKFENIDLDNLKSHSAWQNTIKTVNQIRETFKEIGRINHPENDDIWDKYREITRVFNKKKNQFYKDLKAQHQKNLQRKKDLLAKAEELKDSDDWRNTANELKRIQSDWKKIGYVPKSESDKIWKQFREACNHFFNRLNEKNKEAEKELEANLTTKLALLEELKTWSPSGDKKADLDALKDAISKWKNAGKLPRSAKNTDAEFNKVLDQHFTQIKVNKKESAMLRFENKIHAIAAGDERQLAKEKDQLLRTIDEARKELNQLENNIQFFANANENSPIVKEAQKKIERQKEHIELLNEKLKMLRSVAQQ